MADGWNKSVSQVSGIARLTLEDNGEVAASLRINPADVKLAQRCQKVSEELANIADMLPDDATIDDAVKFTDTIEDKICYLLGYNAKQDLFGQISATAIMPDGRMFVTHLMEMIHEMIAPEISKRTQAMAQAVEKHTAKYTK